MAKEQQRGSRGPTNPPDFPVTPPPPSGDYSYTVELVSSIQHQLGKLTEAVETLKTTTESLSIELRAIGNDVRTAKVVVSIVGGIVTIVVAFLGIALKSYLDYLWRTPAK